MRLVDGFSMSGQTHQQSGVIPLRTKDDFPGCRDLETYWDALRGGAIVPKRTDFDPRGIERSLTHTFVAERVAASVVRVRVAGTHLGELLGMDVRGMPMTAFFDPADRDTLEAACRSLFDGPHKIEMELQSPGRLGRPALMGRLVLLPMSDGQGEITRLVGCLETLGTSGRWPRRFRVTHVEQTALDGSAPEGPRAARKAAASRIKAPAPAPVQERQMAFAEAPQRPFRMKQDPPAPTQTSAAAGTADQSDAPLRGPHLRLVVDND